MKRFILSFVILVGISLSANASELLNIPYKNIAEEGKIKLENDVWTNKVSKKDDNYLIKFISEGTGNYSEFFNSYGQFVFETGCQYEFLNKGDLIGYSNQDLKFYDFTMVNNEVIRRELSADEVQALFPDFKIVKLSEFSPNTHSLKVKKNRGHLKLILLNDTDRTFYHYSFTSGNSKFDTYPLVGFLNIKQKGMLHFSHFGDNTQNNPWFVLLVR